MNTDRLLNPTHRAQSIRELSARVWQLGYVTNDLDAALRTFGGVCGCPNLAEMRMSPANYRRGPTSMPAWNTRFAMGSAGTTVLELIEPISGDFGFYTQTLPEEGSGHAIRLHHLAVAIAPGAAEWDRVERMFEREGFAYEFTVDAAGRIRAAYADTRPLLGHIIEVCQFDRSAVDFYSSLITDGATRAG